MNRRDFVKAGAGIAALGGCSPLASAPVRAETKPPKYILFLMTDQHCPQAMGINRDPHAITPNLDGLAKTGMVFDNTFCQNPLCVPSRTSFMLGRYSHSIGVWGNTKNVTPPRNVKSYTQVMRENGRQASCFGKLHIHGRSDLDWNGVRAWFKNYSTWAHGREPEALEKYRVRGAKHRVIDGKPVNGQCSPYSREAHEEWLVKTHTVNFMRKNVGKPWFIQCSMLRPHGPLFAPPAYWDRFKDHEFSLPSYPADDLDDCHPYLRKHRDAHKMAPEIELDKIKAYYACLNFVDDMFGEVLKEVDSLGIRDETLIVYTADHGDMMGHHGRWGKMTFFERSVKVPLMFSMPGVVEPGRRDAPVELVDMYPTFMDLLGLETPTTVHGRSLLPVLTGREKQHRRVARSEMAYWGWGRAVMQFDGRYKIIYEPKTDSCDMYDLVDDPQEFHNIANDPKHKERIAEAVQSSKAWSQQDTYRRRG